MNYEKCVCERCDELVIVADNQPLSSCDIISLYDMGIDTGVDFVCINCLTDSESDQLDAYISRVEPSKYTPAQAEELIQAASKMLQERLAK